MNQYNNTMTDTQVLEAINTFKINLPNTYLRSYTTVQNYQFTLEDHDIISSEIKTYKDYNPKCMIEFIGELVRDRVNNQGIGLPIIEWD